MARKTTEDAKRDVRRARAAVGADLADLDHHLHEDLPRTIRQNAIIIAAGAAAVGVVAGLGGTKAMKGLVTIALPVALIAIYASRHGAVDAIRRRMSS